MSARTSLRTLSQTARAGCSVSRTARCYPTSLASSSKAPIALTQTSSFHSSPQRSAESEAAQPELSAKIAPIVDQISGLTLLEVSELVQALKTRLNITEVAMPAASAGPASAGPAGGAPAEAAEEEKPKEKTIFTVKLDKFDPASKAKIIKEVKAMMPNMNLVEAKKFVESCPQTLKENLPKEEADKLKKTLEALGATISLE